MRDESFQFITSSCTFFSYYTFLIFVFFQAAGPRGARRRAAAGIEPFEARAHR
jgi:hypothetical protein